jgi:hypothetical protein
MTVADLINLLRKEDQSSFVVSGPAQNALQIVRGSELTSQDCEIADVITR